MCICASARRLAPGPITSLQDYFQARSSPHQLEALDFKQTARSLLQMLAGLHRAGHCLGGLLPERILVKPQLLLLEFCIGTSFSLLHDMPGEARLCSSSPLARPEQRLSLP